MSGMLTMTTDKRELSKVGFDRDAGGYDQSPKYAALRSSYGKIADEALRGRFNTWLDVGCGTGALLALIRERRREAQLFGIDLSDRMIEIARTKLGTAADLRVSDSETIPFQSGRFDLITCTFSFHHYPHPRAVLSEMLRVLSPNGRVIIADPSPFPPLRQILNLLVPVSRDGTVRFYSKKEMGNLVQSAGLAVSTWTKLDWYSSMLVAQRRALPAEPMGRSSRISP